MYVFIVKSMFLGRHIQCIYFILQNKRYCSFCVYAFVETQSFASLCLYLVVCVHMCRYLSVLKVALV